MRLIDLKHVGREHVIGSWLVGDGLADPGPPAPPPDVDIDAWHQSLARIAAWRPERMVVTHFGLSEDVEAQLHDVGRRLDAWAALARDSDEDAFIAAVREEIAAGAPPEL